MRDKISEALKKVSMEYSKFPSMCSAEDVYRAFQSLELSGVIVGNGIKIPKNGSLILEQGDKSHVSIFQTDAGGFSSSRVSFGSNCSSKGRSSSKLIEAGNEIYYFGIVNFLARDNARRKLESFCHRIIGRQVDPLFTNAALYGRRLRNFVRDATE